MVTGKGVEQAGFGEVLLSEGSCLPRVSLMLPPLGVLTKVLSGFSQAHPLDLRSSVRQPGLPGAWSTCCEV